jgi:sortase A
MRRAVGATLTAAGVGLLLFAGATQLRAALARDRARSAWAAEEARATARIARGLGSVSGRIEARGAPIGRLWIPVIGLDEVIVEGVGDRELNAGPGHLPGSALPGERGNAVISAHRDRHFSALGGVALGDTIVTRTRHERTVWQVIDRRIVAAGAPALHSTSEPTLTLTTCWPVRFLGPAPDRLLITAVAVQNAAAASN